jgi:hypothetical protein
LMACASAAPWSVPSPAAQRRDNLGPWSCTRA